ncbi:MAG: DUF4417 domain-containing protein [Planctomycetota bacterium]|jgi:hypothetical protein
MSANPVTESPDAIFPHTADLEIPLLLENRQADFIDLPVRGWGTVSRRSRFQGTWHFYIDDYKFRALWNKPEALLKTKAINVVECNFSTDLQMPYPVVLYRIYQKRWLARYWQEKGKGVFVDLSVPDNWAELNLEGVPRGWQAYATAANDDRLSTLQGHADIALEHAMGRDIRLLVYGGADKTAEMCADNGWVHVRDARNEARQSNG